MKPCTTSSVLDVAQPKEMMNMEEDEYGVWVEVVISLYDRAYFWSLCPERATDPMDLEAVL